MFVLRSTFALARRPLCQSVLTGKDWYRFCSNVSIKKKQFSYPTIFDKYPDTTRFYYFDAIPEVNSIARFKIISIPVLCFCVSGAQFLAENGYITQFDSISCFWLSMFIFIECVVCSIPVINFVGAAYFDENTYEPIISYIDFWGKRHDEKFPRDDLYFQSRQKGMFKNIPYVDVMWVHLVSRKTGKKFKVHIRYASIDYQGTVEELFGKIPEGAF